MGELAEIAQCTEPDCWKLSSLYLCTDCLLELDELLKEARVLAPVLDGAVRQTSVTRAPGSSGGGGGVAKSKPPVSLDALLLQAWLFQLPASAHAVAMDDPTAGHTLFMARLWVKQAADLVWGPEDKRVYGTCGVPYFDGPAPAEGEEVVLCEGKLTASPDAQTVKCQACGEVHRVDELLEKISAKVKGEPMAPRAVREYLQAKARAFITKKDFENWVQLGRLPYVLGRVTTTVRPPRLYYPGDVLSVFEDMKSRRRALL